MEVIRTFWDWAEVWAVLIPLFILSIRPAQPHYINPVIIYLFLALPINLLIDISWLYRHNVPSWLDSNNYLYNIHSVIRLICFSIFFTMLRRPFLAMVKKWLFILALIFILINFLFFEDFFRYISFSSRLFAVESAILLFYCLQYYLSRFQEEDVNRQPRPETWIVTGLSIYVVFNFPYFLLYTTLMESNQHFVEMMWNFHNVCFIILCIFIAIAFYVPRNK